ncbi:MAG TPA: YfhO family protein [Candidatus Obscuribacter sp.]|nr:YfhO family protein [Candidatus Obscuribacter sp.]
MTPEAVHDSFVDLIETAPDIGSVFEQDNFFYRDMEDEKDLERLQMASLNRSVTGLTPGRRPLVSSAKLLTDEDNHLTFSVSMEKDGYFVLNDRFYPGWHVKVDSLPAKLLRANGFMRAVHLNAGSHLVEFDFRPKSFSFGLFLTAVGFALTLVCLLVGLAPLIWQGILFLSYGSSRGKAATASQGVQEQ